MVEEKTKNKMIYRRLGKTGIKVSMIGFGNMFISEVDDESHYDATLQCLKMYVLYIYIYI